MYVQTWYLIRFSQECTSVDTTSRRTVGFPHHLEGFHVGGDKLALIVQHLLEMRHVPTWVGRVPAFYDGDVSLVQNVSGK